MATIVFALPILPGKEDIDREMLERLNAPGAEKDAYVSARRAQDRRWSDPDERFATPAAFRDALAAAPEAAAVAPRERTPFYERPAPPPES